jgi:hypothetical protein
VTPLHGYRVAVSSALVGSKRAIRMGDTIYVSPAMYDLMKHADQEELQRLLAAIPLLEAPDLFNPYGPLPMTTPRRDAP